MPMTKPPSGAVFLFHHDPAKVGMALTAYKTVAMFMLYVHTRVSRRSAVGCALRFLRITTSRL